MKHFLLFTLLLISSGLAVAQNGRISGIVVDSANAKPVEFATIAVNAPGTNKPLNGGVADDKGKFNIKNLPLGKYDVVVSFIGYQTKVFQVNLTDANPHAELNYIKISVEASLLQEVVVEAQKPLVEERVDRTIYNAENDATARGGDATDVLKRVPMLSVDLDGNVSLRGSQNIMVLINNKPSTIVASSVADALKQIPADQIKSVEVITSPSAKYDAEGSAGIINIITKKNTLQGLTLNIDAGVGYRGSNLGLNGNYRKGKMGFSLGGFGRANYNVQGAFENSQLTTQTVGTPKTSLNIQSADTRSQGLFGNYNLGWDYDINAKNSLAANVRIGARNNTSYQDGLTSMYYDTDELISSSVRDTKTRDNNNSIDANFTYTRTFEKPQREFSILSNYSRNNRDNNFVNRFLEENGIADVGGIRNINDSFNEEMTIQADYSTPVGSTQIVEFGAKNIYRKVFSNFKTATDEDGDGSYELQSTRLSNNLNYNQNVTAGYFSYTYAAKSGVSFKAGSRYEYTTITAYSQTESNIEIPSYGALVPSINLSKRLKNSNTLKAAYNRRIQRPSIRFLNPNLQASNPYNVSQGNPTLDPEYTNNFELSYSTLVKGSSINFTAFWRNTNNGIQDVRDVIAAVASDPDTIRTTYRNIGQEDAIGSSIFANVNLGKLSLNMGGDVYYVLLDNKVSDPVYSASNEGLVYSGRFFGSYNMKNGWGLQFFGFYRGNQVQLQGKQGGFGTYSLGLRKDFKNKRGSFGLGLENFLTPVFKIRNELTTPLIDQSGVNKIYNMSFRANISYRIGKMTMEQQRPRRRRSINNDDLKEGGEDGGQGGQGQGGQGGQGGQSMPGGTNGGRQGTVNPAQMRQGGATGTGANGATGTGNPATNGQMRQGSQYNQSTQGNTSQVEQGADQKKTEPATDSKSKKSKKKKKKETTTP